MPKGDIQLPNESGRVDPDVAFSRRAPALAADAHGSRKRLGQLREMWDKREATRDPSEGRSITKSRSMRGGKR